MCVSDKSGGERIWEKFKHAARLLSKPELDTVRRLFDFTRENGKIKPGKGKRQVSFLGKFPAYDTDSVYAVFEDGKLAVCAIPRPRHHRPDERAYRVTCHTRAAFEEAGFPMCMPRKYLNDYSDTAKDQWMPRVDKVIEVLSELVKKGKP